jgi:hypothetical protein
VKSSIAPPEFVDLVTARVAGPQDVVRKVGSSKQFGGDFRTDLWLVTNEPPNSMVRKATSHG